MKVCVCGFGVVGKGVVEILDRKEPGKVKAIFTREILDDQRYVNDVDTMLEDKEIKIIVEAMGGLDAAYDLATKALKKGKHVVTSNKELVDKYMVELLELAKDNNVKFLFEASVGGGIPLVSTLQYGLVQENIVEVQAILNGTTNYILTKMLDENRSYEDVLKEAQELGYAEKDPKDDVEGFDSARKIAILSSLIKGNKVNYAQVNIQGINNMNDAMVQYAKNNNYRIKLIAKAKLDDKDVSLSVLPTLIDASHPLYNVNGVQNAVLITGTDVGEVMLQGPGAGRYPTASAIVADVYQVETQCNHPFVVKEAPVDVVVEDVSVIDFIENKKVSIHDIHHPSYLVLGKSL